MGEFTAADQILSEGLHYLWQWGPATDSDTLTAILVESLRQMADIRQREGVFNQALTYLEAGLQVLGEAAAQDEPELWRALLDRMAWIRFRQGQLAEAFELATEATDGVVPTNIDDPIRQASLYNTLGGICWQLGQPDKAIGYVENSLRLYERVGYLWGKAVAFGNLGILFFGLGNWPKAGDYYERAYSVQQVIGNSEGQAVVLDNLGILRMVKGDYETALRDLRAGLAIRQRLGDAWGTAQSHINLARLALRQSCLDDAAAHAETALQMSEDIGSKEIQISAQWCLAVILADRGLLREGVEKAEQALTMARAVGFMEGEIDCLRVLGRLRLRMGLVRAAEDHLTGSVDLCREQNARYQRGLALFELGRLYQQQARLDDLPDCSWQSKAQATLGEAAEIFETLGAGPDHSRVLAALGQIPVGVQQVTC